MLSENFKEKNHKKICSFFSIVDNRLKTPALFTPKLVQFFFLEVDSGTSGPWDSRKRTNVDY